ncbi:uncharacterized protein LOC6031352 [Culex quinquefasciatus]|uniref:uncharacterized protein LOC6031352 n=1 Tax=Culex quinquefasciatus TaxID=7176 RepID=UPI0018E2D48B|nr:uncharacterized protein LOC6031352 [Culex quinquefasciatus]
MGDILLQSILLPLLVVTFTTAQRPSTLKVIDDLRYADPYMRAHRNLVLDELHAARLNASDLQSEMIQLMANQKQRYVELAVDAEKALVGDIDREIGDAPCLGYLRNIVENNMYMAGIFFTNCVDELDAKLDAETNSVYGELQRDEISFMRGKLLDAFNRENMVRDPERISEKLAAKTVQYQQLSTTAMAQWSSIVGRFRDRLVTVRSVYEQCLINNQNLLQLIFDNTKRQLSRICRHGL